MHHTYSYYDFGILFQDVTLIVNSLRRSLDRLKNSRGKPHIRNQKLPNKMIGFEAFQCIVMHSSWLSFFSFCFSLLYFTLLQHLYAPINHKVSSDLTLSIFACRMFKPRIVVELKDKNHRSLN